MYIKNSVWQGQGMPGCCGVHVLYRLFGVNITKTSHLVELNGLLNACKDQERPGRLLGSPQNQQSVESSLSFMVRTLTQKSKCWQRTDIPAIRTAVPLDTMFTAVLQSVPKQALIYLTDNMSGEGDVYLGSFTTRSFKKWYVDNELGAIVTSGPVTSTRTQKQIQGWILTPNWPTINKLIKIEHEKLLQFVKDTNNDPRIKSINQSRINERVHDARRLAATVLDGWGQ
jgi:hypothetical protein